MGVLTESLHAAWLAACLAGTASAVLAPTASVAQEIRLAPGDIEPRHAHEFDLPADGFADPPGLDRFETLAREIASGSALVTGQAIERAARDMGVPPEAATPAEALAAAPGVARLPEGVRASILVSAALGENTLKDMLHRYRLRKDVRFVFRGIPPDMTVPQFGLWLARLAALSDDEMNQPPGDLNIVLDPELFSLARVELVPTVLLEDLNRPFGSDGGANLDLGHVIARAEGYSDPDWLHDRMTSGASDTLTNPNVVQVSEEDLRVRAEREAAAVSMRLTRDPATLARRFWDRAAQQLDAMPVTPAPADRRRELHFLARTAEAIRDHDGRILAHPGEVFRPADVLPFDRRILVIDPQDPAEMAFAARAMAAPRPGVTRALVVATRVPTPEPGGDPWQGLSSLVDRLQVPVYLLNDEFRRAFGIEHTPTEIFPETLDGTTAVISQETMIR